MEKETLEEAKDRKYPLTNILHIQLNTAIRTGFEEGAKWQQEQDKKMYSEEEVFEIVLKARTECYLLTNCETKEWFEQFKKK
jgi:hypothetical protein